MCLHSPACRRNPSCSYCVFTPSIIDARKVASDLCTRSRPRRFALNSAFYQPGLTQDQDSGLTRQSAGGRLALAAVHQAVVHFHAVDAEGAVGEQRESGVLGRGERKIIAKGKTKRVFEKKVGANVSAD